MPTYDYQCDACSHEFELFQGINDPVKKKCPECGKRKLRRLFGTGAAVVFKGSGFYQTDYRSDSYKKGAEAEKKAGEKSSGPSSSGSSSGESKSAGADSSPVKSTDAKSAESKSSTAEKKKKASD